MEVVNKEEFGVLAAFAQFVSSFTLREVAETVTVNILWVVFFFSPFVKSHLSKRVCIFISLVQQVAQYIITRAYYTFSSRYVKHQGSAHSNNNISISILVKDLTKPDARGSFFESYGYVHDEYLLLILLSSLFIVFSTARVFVELNDARKRGSNTTVDAEKIRKIYLKC